MFDNIISFLAGGAVVGVIGYGAYIWFTLRSHTRDIDTHFDMLFDLEEEVNDIHKKLDFLLDWYGEETGITTDPDPGEEAAEEEASEDVEAVSKTSVVNFRRTGTRGSKEK